jgi:thiol-disulfide isomerase/thioredoxin
MTTEAMSSPIDARRRTLLYAGIGAAAAVAGAAVALWEWRGTEGGRVDPSLWSASFETPAGAPLAMQSFRGKPLVLNFWATWCPPCVEEMPLLESFFKQNAGKSIQVVGLAIDQPSAVRSFLQRTPVSYPVGLAGLGGTELTKILGNESGGLPFTVVIGADGEVVQRRMGRVSKADLSRWAQLAA